MTFSMQGTASILVPSVASTRFGRVRDYVPFLVILALAAALRFYRIGQLELWLDEDYSVVAALSPQGVLRCCMNDNNPPLYFLLLKGWIALFGIGEGAVRSLSACCGVAQLGVLGLLLTRLGLARRVAGWAMLLGALAPLHHYYSQEARGYTLDYLMLTLLMWSLARAVAAGRRRDWAAHGVCLLLALYTHNLFVFFIPALALGAWALGLGRRGWLRLGAAVAGAGLLYLPWLWLTLGVVGNGSLAWMAGSWDSRTWPLLIPRTLEALWPGGRLPEILRMVPSTAGIHALALVMLAVVLGAVYWPRGRGERRGGEEALSTKAVYWRPVLFLTALLVAPLVAMVGYSAALHPIYLVGRYDTLVYPAMLGLAGVGAERVQAGLSRRARPLLGFLLILVPLAGLSLTALAPRLVARFDDPMYHPQAERAKILMEFWRPGDMIVCMGLEGAKVIYEMRLRGAWAPVKTFPLETLEHLGYFSPSDVALHLMRLEEDARKIVDEFEPRGREGRRLWVMMDSHSFRQARPGGEDAAYTAIAMTLMAELRERGLVLWSDPEFNRRAGKMGIWGFVGKK